MDAAKALDIDLAGEYLLMGATLAHIKSRMLLPREQTQDVDGSEPGPDPREELPLAADDAAYFKSPELSVYRLIELMARVLEARRIEIPHEVFVERLSIGDRISVITD